ncbi:MAG: PhzF family phenazine biosynthesis protein [Bacillaceae bacterium]|nr:PhzF family phenazine biosynthesis protein [Bacillaceae bacterium]
MTNHVYLINAFSSSAFHGNPAAVVLLEENRDRDWLKSLAMELRKLGQLYNFTRNQVF